MLLFHKLGSGKTCSAIAIADEFIRRNGVRARVYIFSPGGLREGWIKEYCRQCGKDFKQFMTNYTFVTYNTGFIVPRITRMSFDGSLVIIDEIHNVINGVRNQTKTSKTIYDNLMESDCRILALSGTPIQNNYLEWPILGNLLSPGRFVNTLIPKGRGKLAFNKNIFPKQFTITKNNEIIPKDPESFEKQLEGMISYYPGGDKRDYPEVYEHTIVTYMTPTQARAYDEAYGLENLLLGDREKKGMSKKQLKIWEELRAMASQRIMSRGVSNYMYPPEAYIKGEAYTGNDMSEYLKEYSKGMFLDKSKTKGGWITKELINANQLRTKYYPKIASLLEVILNNFNEKHVVYSFFTTRRGAELTMNILNICTNGQIPMKIYSGDVDPEERQDILDTFNSVENRYGKKIKILFISLAGGQGITILETKYLHILESDVKESRIEQVKGRVSRYRSHAKLPDNEKYVHIYRYIINESEKVQGVDGILLDKGKKRHGTY